MKRILTIILIVLFGLVGLAHGQTPKDIYLIVKKLELKATGPRAEFEKSMSEARAEFDLFKDSKAAKKNPEFTTHISNALEALRTAKFYSERQIQAYNPKAPKLWKEHMDYATK
jgi:hypothetical protein